MCRLGSLGSGQTLVASSCEYRNELLGLKIQILWNVILCWLLSRSFFLIRVVGLLENIFSLMAIVKTWTSSLYLKWAKSSI
jgi:hypothetical protein